jgi:hypothetical protein
MEFLLTDNESSLVLLFTVLGSFATLLAAFGSLLMLQPSQVRRLLLALLILVGLAEVLLVGWGINSRRAKAAAAEKKKIVKPRPGPAPKSSPKEVGPKPTEVELKSNETEEQAMASGVTFTMSSRSDASIRQQYCVDSVLSGTFYSHGGRLMVKLHSADFDLCKYSSDGQRQIEFRVGIGTNNDVAKKNWKAISWSQSQKGSVNASGGSQLAPEEALVVPMKRHGKNKSAPDLRTYAAVVSVYNRDRRGLYYLKDENK